MRTDVVVVGAGQSGLAISRLLGDHNIDHVVLERGEVANSWRTERWDSLRLLTPNWMTRLPAWCYRGNDPDGFMTNSEVIDLLVPYQANFHAPVKGNVSVELVKKQANGVFTVKTSHGTWTAKAVVIATGACSEPAIPALAAELPTSIEQLTANRYRSPGHLADGDVLVVGASASGLQIADEIQRSGRRVTIAVGEHIRLPRSYRGRDIHWWMDAIGILDERYDEVDDIDRARRLASLQLVGSSDHRTLDLNALVVAGARVVGKLMRVDGQTAQFSGGVTHLVVHADLKQSRLLDRIDTFVAEQRFDTGTHDVLRPDPTFIGDPPTDLALAGFGSVIWATGYRPTFSFLDADCFDRRRRPLHDGGIAQTHGLYFLGLPFMRRRKSNFIDGVGPDAVEIMRHLCSYLGSKNVGNEDVAAAMYRSDN
jgi:putative flavoprotein involved in K+ transport